MNEQTYTIKETSSVTGFTERYIKLFISNAEIEKKSILDASDFFYTYPYGKSVCLVKQSGIDKIMQWKNRVRKTKKKGA